MQKEIKVIALYMIVLAVSYCMVARYADGRRNGEKSEVSDASVSDEMSGVPRWYGLLPALPLMILMLFGVVIRSIHISVSAACLLSYAIALCASVIGASKGERINAINAGQIYFEGMGNALKGVGAMMLSAGIFAMALQRIGGFELLVGLTGGQNSGREGTVLLAGIIISLFYALTIILSGNMGSFAALFITLACSMTSGNLLCKVMGILVLGSPMFDAVSPIAPGVLVVAEGAQLPVMRLIRRVLFSIVLGYAAVIAGVLIFY